VRTLGLKEALPVSAVTGSGVKELMDEIDTRLHPRREAEGKGA